MVQLQQLLNMLEGTVFKNHNSSIQKLLFEILLADYYTPVVLVIMPVSLVFCQKFLCAVFASEGPRLIFRHPAENID
jgi:hypothetical protein